MGYACGPSLRWAGGQAEGTGPVGGRWEGRSCPSQGISDRSPGFQDGPLAVGQVAVGGGPALTPPLPTV